MGTGINTFGNRNLVIADNSSFRNIGRGILVEDSWEVVVERNQIYENNLGPGLEVSNEDNQ